ncbi:hypothetical protein A3Q56_02365 [Intoshia linei]|uniref:C2H2-type domain-containing protein n=1 Tax=Intoshia linei TaxID=1819745 RepID=A0A177B6L5_9BILA|nr:hypothetical protein A3Q56_02365 [Intoshia linei]
MISETLNNVPLERTNQNQSNVSVNDSMSQNGDKTEINEPENILTNYDLSAKFNNKVNRTNVHNSSNNSITSNSTASLTSKAATTVVSECDKIKVLRYEKSDNTRDTFKMQHSNNDENIKRLDNVQTAEIGPNVTSEQRVYSERPASVDNEVKTYPTKLRCRSEEESSQSNVKINSDVFSLHLNQTSNDSKFNPTKNFSTNDLNSLNITSENTIINSNSFADFYNPKRKNERILPVKQNETVFFKCPLCFQKMENVKELTKHIRLHNNPSETPNYNQCTICNKILSSQSSLDRHMLVHSGERPFECCYCTMTFTTNGNMHRHMRIHSKDQTEPIHKHASGKCSLTSSKYAKMTNTDIINLKKNSKSLTSDDIKLSSKERISPLKRNWTNLFLKTSESTVYKNDSNQKTARNKTLDNIFSTLMWKAHKKTGSLNSEVLLNPESCDSESNISKSLSESGINTKEMLSDPVYIKHLHKAVFDGTVKRRRLSTANEIQENLNRMKLEDNDMPIKTLVKNITSYMQLVGEFTMCTICNETFKNKDDYAIHIQKNHSTVIGLSSASRWVLRYNSHDDSYSNGKDYKLESKLYGSRSRKQSTPINLSKLRCVSISETNISEQNADINGDPIDTSDKETMVIDDKQPKKFEPLDLSQNLQPKLHVCTDCSYILYLDDHSSNFELFLKVTVNPIDYVKDKLKKCPKCEKDTLFIDPTDSDLLNEIMAADNKDVKLLSRIEPSLIVKYISLKEKQIN